MSPRVSDVVKSAHTTPVGDSDHLAVVAKICPTMQFKPSRVWRFSQHILQKPEFLQGMDNIFAAKRGLRGEVWWELVLQDSWMLASKVAKRSRLLTRGILQMQKALAESEC